MDLVGDNMATAGEVIGQMREAIEVLELENGYLKKKIEQLEQELGWAKKEVRELKCQ